MVSFKKSLYVACALNAAPKEYMDEVAAIKQLLEGSGINVLHFLGLGEHTPLSVYEWDIEECVGKCSAFLGIYGGHDSDGRGFETSQALSRGIPMLGVALKGQKVSKVILGAYEKHGWPFIFVDNLLGEVPNLVTTHLLPTKGLL